MAGTFSVLPPGLGEQTMTTQMLVNKMGKKTRTVRRKKKTTRRKTRRKKATAKRKTTRRKKPARLVKGSAAAKRHMAKLRRMRGKKR